ncbi:MAG: molybdopterin cofactor-binding domain-containing protein, partial [Sphingobium sp.]
VEGQIAGGLAQGIGSVLMEEAGYDRRGNPIAATFKDYLLPTIFDIPDFEYVHANTPSKAEGGFRGVGEGGCIIGPPTLVNAIADALAPFGDVPVDLPLTPSKLLAIIEGKPLPDKPMSRFHPEWADPDADPAPAPAAQRDGEVEDVPPGATLLPGGTHAALSEPASARIDGAWRMTLATPMGPQPMMAHFETDGPVLRGRLESDQGTQAFEGTVDGHQVKWDMKVTKPMSLTLKYALDFDGDTLTGKCKMGMFGTAKVKGERA